MKEWSRQELLQRSGVPNINELILLVRSIPNIRTKALYIITYLTAGRICEVVRYKRMKKQGLVQWDSIKKKDIFLTEKSGREIILINLRNEKNPKRYSKEIPIPLDRQENIYLWNDLLDYLNTLELEQELFPFGYQMAYKLLKPYCNPHWIRHIRLTHLTTMYDFSELLLQRYAGWTDTRPSKDYVELKWQDFLDKY